MKASQKIKWEDFLSVKKTFSISSSVTKSQINNSLYASQALKDGIADYFRDKFAKRPDVNVKNPDVRFNLHIEKDNAVISLDIWENHFIKEDTGCWQVKHRCRKLLLRQ